MCKVCDYRKRKSLENRRAQKAIQAALIQAIAAGKVIRLFARDEITGLHYRLDRPETVEYTVTGNGDNAS